jgi:hypothetical protein
MHKARARRLGERLLSLTAPDRQSDCLATWLLTGPPASRLDENPGLDGWDILVLSPGDEPVVWMAADEVLYVTRYVDAAIELCVTAFPNGSTAIVQRAVLALAKGGVEALPGTDVAGAIARRITAETLYALAQAPAEQAA